MVWTSFHVKSEIEENTKDLQWKNQTRWYRWIFYLGPFYLANSAQKNYFISCEDDCSRKVSSECSERKRSVDVLQVLEDYIVENGKPDKVMHDNGKQFTSKIFRHFLLQRNNIKDKSIPATRYPQLLQGKIDRGVQQQDS